jgi:hypothetical protein
MKKIFGVLAGILLIILCSSWGFFAHYRINRLAVYTLPAGMSNFYKANIEYITAHAVSADKKRYVDSTEAPRHFLNADYYGKKPFLKIPQKWKDAAKKYPADTLNKYGTVPWAIQYQYYRLVRAFKAHDTTAILNTSANLAHYIADAHVPLHLTKNYDGQLTDQTGLHALWESRLPEYYANYYKLYAGRARYIENPLKEAFKICRTSFACVDSVLLLERRINAKFTSDAKYAMVQRGERTVNDYSPEYCKAYHLALNGMVRRRMRSTILAVGSYWYSAWVDAGQPNLNKLIDSPLTNTEKAKLLKEETGFKLGKPFTSVLKY